MDFFKDFEKVKDRIVYRLIHAGRNKELLDEIPHIPFWDLAICFSYSFWSEELGDGMILIRNEHMESWKGLLTSAYLNEDRAFISCILEDSEPKVTGIDGRMAVAVTVAGNTSITEKRIVELA